MRSATPSFLAAALALCLLPAWHTAQAHDAKAMHGLAGVNSLSLVVNGPDRKALNRDNTSDLCLVALTHALQKEHFSVAGSRAKADAELVLTGSYVTITEGWASNIGETTLSYAVAVKDRSGAVLWSMVADAEGDSIAEACMEAAEEIAEELEDARDDARD